MWRRCDFLNFIFPDAVILNLFAAARFVFIFDIKLTPNLNSQLIAMIISSCQSKRGEFSADFVDTSQNIPTFQSLSFQIMAFRPWRTVCNDECR
jgi:hypothetical protein